MNPLAHDVLCGVPLPSSHVPHRPIRPRHGQQDSKTRWTRSPGTCQHRRRARCKDRIRTAKDIGLTNLPLHGFSQNQIWLAIVALASELTAWMQMLALTSCDARRWEPKRLRLRLFSIAGHIARHARKTRLRLSERAPWSGLITSRRWTGSRHCRRQPESWRILLARIERTRPGKWNPAVSRLDTGRPITPEYRFGTDKPDR